MYLPRAPDDDAELASRLARAALHARSLRRELLWDVAYGVVFALFACVVIVAYQHAEELVRGWLEFTSVGR